MSFPSDFIWGVAAASFQIEGQLPADGIGKSVWDAFCERPGAIFSGHDGQRACEHYKRYAEDVSLIGELGAKAYRLSISWPRVIPTGTGEPNEAGLDFYDRLIDALLSHNVQPWVTLFHWDFPVDLFHKGGWLNRESVEWFADYTRVLAERLGDRVQHWMTFNEPQIFLGMGHQTGQHAPGMKYNRSDVLRATHNVLLAHGRAAQEIRKHAKLTPKIGWAPHGSIPYPKDNSPENIQAAKRALYGVPDSDYWFFSTTWFSDPVLLGNYPQEGLSRFGRELPSGFEQDMDLISQPMDFLGLNIYQGNKMAVDADGNDYEVARPNGYPHTMCHWPIEPEVLYWGPQLLYQRYNLPIYITENGCASMDWVHQDGKVHDAPRVDYTARHLTSLSKAITDGADVRGYFHWSILDNFEWAEGYRMRFGLIYVDFNTMERICKDSYRWYQQVILSNGECLPKNPSPLR